MESRGWGGKGSGPAQHRQRWISLDVREGLIKKKGLIKVPGQCCSCGTVIVVWRDTACGSVDAV